MSLVQAPDLLNFEGHEIRAHLESDHVWFVAKDICKALDIPWKGTSGTLRAIKEEWRGVCKFQTPSGEQPMAVILEPAVYKLAFRSNKPEAERLTDWLASEVMPSIRRTGGYQATPETTTMFQHPLDDVPPPSQTPLFFSTEPEVDVVINYNDNTVSLTLPLPELHRIVPLAGPQKGKKRAAPYSDTMLRRATQGMHGWLTIGQVAKAVGCGPRVLRDRARDGRLPSGWLGEFRGGQWWVFIP